MKNNNTTSTAQEKNAKPTKRKVSNFIAKPLKFQAGGEVIAGLDLSLHLHVSVVIVLAAYCFQT